MMAGLPACRLQGEEMLAGLPARQRQGEEQPPQAGIIV
jgi:hypothetical protein